jgi:hypothetical protein
MRPAHQLASLLKLAVPLGLLALFLPACDSLSSFSGDWEGPVSADPNLQQGFTPQAQLGLTIATLDNGSLDMSVRLPGTQEKLRFEAIRRASADSVGSLSLPGDPLRSYLGYVRPAGQEPLLMLVSLFPPNHVETRIIRGPDEVYGVFRLRKL